MKNKEKIYEYVIDIVIF